MDLVSSIHDGKLTTENFKRKINLQSALEVFNTCSRLHDCDIEESFEMQTESDCFSVWKHQLYAELRQATIVDPRLGHDKSFQTTSYTCFMMSANPQQTYTLCSWVRFPRRVGMLPFNRLLFRLSAWRLMAPSSCPGMLPDSWLFSTELEG